MNGIPNAYEIGDVSVEPLDTLRDYVTSLSSRERQILALRHVRRESPLTLDALGAHFGCSRERVRQIEKEVQTSISKKWKEAKYLFTWPLTLGIVSWSEATKILDLRNISLPSWDLVDENSVDQIAIQIVLGGLGLIEESGYVGKSEKWDELNEILRTIQTSRGIPLSVVRRRVEAVVSSLDSEFLASLLTRFGLELTSEGEIEPRARTLQEQILRIFEKEGRPLSKGEVKARSGLTMQQTRSILQRKSAFSWVGKGIFAPKAWGLPLYEGTEAALVQALQERGGEARIDEIVEEVVSRFGCTESSCNIYLGNRALFAREGPLVRLTSREDRPVLPGNPARQRSVYSDLQGGLVWGIDVDNDVLRGSGRQVPPSIASALGASQLGELPVSAPGGSVRIKRSGVFMQISSLRGLAETLSASHRDRILLKVREEEHRWDLAVYDKANGLKSALYMVGQSDVRQSAELLSRACWQSDPTLLRETLWDRDERVLLDLLGLPARNPNSNILDVSGLVSLLDAHGLKKAAVLEHADLPSHVFNQDAGSGQAQLKSVERCLVLRALKQLTGESTATLSVRIFH